MYKYICWLNSIVGLDRWLLIIVICTDVWDKIMLPMPILMQPRFRVNCTGGAKGVPLTRPIDLLREEHSFRALTRPAKGAWAVHTASSSVGLSLFACFSLRFSFSLFAGRLSSASAFASVHYSVDFTCILNVSLYFMTILKREKRFKNLVWVVVVDE